jgi:dienelactone hydrolase
MDIRLLLMHFLGIPMMFAALMTGLTLSLVAQAQSAARLFQPKDLFRMWQVGNVAWSSDGRYAAIEIVRPSHTLDRTAATSEIRLLDVRTRTLRTFSPSAGAYLSFFNAVWSPDGRRLALLSVDAKAVVRAWVWTVGTLQPRLLNDLDVRVGIADTPLVWVGADRLAVLAWERGAEKSGLLYYRILRGRNVTTGWQRAIAGRVPAVSTLESGGPVKTEAPSARLVLTDVRAGARRTLARGNLHRVSVSADQRLLAYLQEKPGVPVSSYLAAKTADAGYDAVNWGTERHVINLQTGAEVEPSFMPAPPRPAQNANVEIPAPRPDARRLSVAPTNDAALFMARASDGTHLWLAGGGGRPLSASSKIWQANEWMRELKLGTAEPIKYEATDGTPLTAWLLLPPDYAKGTKLPVVTIVYPGLVYGATAPAAFLPHQINFEHPQLFAALGYAVLLPSMPEPKNPTESHSLRRLPLGVLPALDAVVAQGIADPDRIAVLGQSDGGFAVLGLLTQTNRFRSAIASASFGNLVSLYGTLYGQYRYGDGGRPEKGQVLRMLQMEKGAMGMDGPPWEQPDRYRENSAVLQADKITTPLMLVHGDQDFIPIQQAEEFFTALYRQDKRARLMRYQGEGHTIAYRANVLDLWQRMANWLAETLASRP